MSAVDHPAHYGGAADVLDGSTSLPTMAAALVAAEMERRNTVTEVARIEVPREQRPPLWARVALTTRLVVTLPQWLADDRFPGGVSAEAERDEDGSVIVRLQRNHTSAARFGQVGVSKRHGPIRTLQVKPGAIAGVASLEGLLFGAVEPSGVTEVPHGLAFRIALERMRAPQSSRGLRRARKAEPPPKSPAEALAIRDLVKAINAHVGVDEGLELSITPAGRLKATIMVEIE